MKTMPRILSVSIIIILSSITAIAQPYDPSKVNKKAISFYEQARERAEAGNLASAIGLLQQAVQTDARYVDAYLGLAKVYQELKNYRNSVLNFEKAIAIDSNYTINFRYSYSLCLAGIGEFEKSLASINELFTKAPPKNEARLKEAREHKKAMEFAVEFLKTNPDKNYVFEPKNAGSSVNSPESEYFPTLSLDGNALVFTRRINNRNEDFYFSRLNGNIWEPAKPIEGRINTPQSEAAQNISTDGQWLVFTAIDRDDSRGNYDLYISYNSPQGWTEATNLGNSINSDQWDSQPCLSPDKRDLYFASRRLGGLGGSDIYVCHLQPNGKWSAPENLGAPINTAGDDQCPFIHADNQTMYFVSNGHQGYGGNDLFISRKTYAGEWEQVKNLGYPINTIDDEGTLFIAADGKTAYYASDRSDSKGGLDIYSFELPVNVRPFKTLWVKGKVYDRKTNAGLPSSVELTDLANGQLITKVQTDESGNYLITLPVGKDYAFNVNRKGYLFYSDNFLMLNKSPDSTYEKNISLQPIELNASIVLKNIFFDINKWDLKPESKSELDKLVQLLNENPGLKIEISGHTDNVGKPADNLMLSNNRAKAVVEYLQSKNITPQRLIAKGYGETKPVAENKTEEGRAQNRRTELKVLAQ
jgi:outer membrane protein OmpA-like peptidoglycan-associated protein/tetratricopeptide (TPR) repeat protein